MTEIVAKAVVMGEVECGDAKYPMALVLTFESREALKQALNDQRIAFSVFDEQPPAPSKGQQCPWAMVGSHMCRESFAAREEGRGTTKLRFPHGDSRNKPEDDPYHAAYSTCEQHEGSKG